MARAKRSDRDRAEARRRYRAALVARTGSSPDDAEEGGEAAEPSPAPAASTGASTGRRPARAGGSRAASAPQGRLGLAQAFRAAFRPANIGEDLRELPRLLANRAVWIPIALSALSVLLFIVLGPANVIAAFAFNTFGLPPALAAIFITGFFVPRASYLAGGIVAAIAAVFYSAFVVVASQGMVPGVDAIGTDRIPGEMASAFAIGPVSGVVFGSAAAWYRRFLFLSSPARSGRAGGRSARSGSNAGRPSSRRR